MVPLLPLAVPTLDLSSARLPLSPWVKPSWPSSRTLAWPPLTIISSSPLRLSLWPPMSSRPPGKLSFTRKTSIFNANATGNWLNPINAVTTFAKSRFPARVSLIRLASQIFITSIIGGRIPRILIKVGSRTHFHLVDMGPSDEARMREVEDMNMSCNHPFKAFWTGRLTETGKRDYVIMPNTSGDLLSIDYLEKKGIHYSPAPHFKEIDGRIFISDPVAIPCGSCVGCRMMSARDWKIRLCKEAEDYPEMSWFVTLTYDDAHLPVNEYGEPILVKKHIQDFMKNLRGYRSIRKYRYFACGEYGASTHRPHYHLILFGPLDELFPVAFGVFESPLIYDAWKFGKHEVVRAEPGTMAYTAGYMEKKQNDPFWDSYPVKPFRLMSRKPMIGWKCLDKIGFPDVSVYGNFGNFHNAQAPKAFTKKLEHKPWYPDFKARNEAKAKASINMSSVVFGSSDQDIVGFRKDKKCYGSLEKVRKDKL